MFEVRDAGEIERALKAASDARAGALLGLTGGLLFPHARRIAELAARSRLPAMYLLRFYVEAGGLTSYSADLNDIWRRALEDPAVVGTILAPLGLLHPADSPGPAPPSADLRAAATSHQ